MSMNRRALTGAWIETRKKRQQYMELGGRALTGAWIETRESDRAAVGFWSRPHGRVD